MTNVNKGRIRLAVALLLLVPIYDLTHYKSWDWTYERSRQAVVDENAPLQARAEIDIAAPPKKVWQLLADANN